MKTQRRHELQTNVLADWLGHQIEQVRPYSKAIVLVSAAVLLAFLVGAYIVTDQSARMSSGWSDFYAASFERSADRLRSVAEDHPGTVAALWATLGEADLEQARGLQLLFTDRKTAEEALKRALASYAQVEKSASKQPGLLLAARFGLAQVHEALSELDTARQYYEIVARESDTALGREAQRRLELLSDKEIIRFYNWFARQDPQPQLPPDFPSGLDLPGLGDLPERPNLPIPQSAPTTESGAETGVDASEAAEGTDTDAAAAAGPAESGEAGGLTPADQNDSAAQGAAAAPAGAGGDDPP